MKTKIKIRMDEILKMIFNVLVIDNNDNDHHDFFKR